MTLEIIDPGVMTTLQDAGRPGFRALGIPQSGAADRLSFALANYGIGNSWTAPALEISLGGLKLKAHQATRMILTGAPRAAKCGDNMIAFYKAFTLNKGDILEVNIGHISAHTYLAVAGGLVGQMFKGSCATYSPATIGGLKGSALTAGDHVENAKLTTTAEPMIDPAYRPHLGRSVVLRVQKGVEFDTHLSADTQRRLFTSVLTADAQTDRMGAFLRFAHNDEPDFSLSDKTPLTSSPLLPGTLQITSNGTPILSGVDSHCTGGYVRALSVIPADQWIMGQIAPGTRVSFRRERTSAAEEALSYRNRIYGQLIDGFHFDS